MNVGVGNVAVGDELGPLELVFTRHDLVRYAGASLDFNPIHWNETFAKEVGLPDVIAHGMLTMAAAGRLVTDWIGDPGKVVEYGVRFTRPVPVPNDDAGVALTVTGKVNAVSDEAASVLLTVKCDGKTVLGKAVTTVSLR